eukprot:gb/GEZN01006290.1/.p1 GENE.gb/GEZN01006290.1/~~gb/GEZN01006290.1/.p1  ORF type:complete len:479 (-),score=66.14 gb/GEZN01006290.1/:94-1530(-)
MEEQQDQGFSDVTLDEEDQSQKALLHSEVHSDSKVDVSRGPDFIAHAQRSSDAETELELVRRQLDIKPLVGLRGVCVLFVVIGHYFTFYGPPGEFVFQVEYLSAMSLFFLLSGFYMALMYGRVPSRDEHTHATYNFFIQTGAAALPLYWLSLLLYFPLLLWTPGWFGSSSMVKSMLQTPLLIQTWGFWLDESLGWNGPAWVVSALALCCVLYPTLSRSRFANDVRSIRLVYGLGLVLSVSIFYICAAFLPGLVLAVHLSAWFRLFHFYAGMVVVLDLRSRARPNPTSVVCGCFSCLSRRPHVLADLVSIFYLLVSVCIVGLLSSKWNMDTNALFGFWMEFGLVPLLGCWLRALCAPEGTGRTNQEQNSQRSITARILSSYPLKKLGEWAYPLYLFHLPIFQYATLVKQGRWYMAGTIDKYNNSPDFPFALSLFDFFVCLLFLLCFSSALHRFVEEPFRKKIIHRWCWHENSAAGSLNS